MIPAAELVHAAPGRIRLRIPERKGDDDWFADTRRAINQFPGIVRVIGNSATGSFLIRGKDLAVRQIPEVGEERGWFAVRDPARSGGAAADALASLAPVFLGLAVIQAVRGQIMVPAISLAWYALEIVRWEELRADQ
jgi:hypothetical protein